MSLILVKSVDAQLGPNGLLPSGCVCDGATTTVLMDGMPSIVTEVVSSEPCSVADSGYETTTLTVPGFRRLMLGGKDVPLLIVAVV